MTGMEARKLHTLAESYVRGDAHKQDEFLEAVQPVLLGYVRRSMGGKLRSMEQSIDVSQSLLLGLHMRLASGELRFSDDRAFKGYLKQMVSHKLASHAEAAGAQKRGNGQAAKSLGDEVSIPPARNELTASVAMRVKETKARIDEEITDDERFILEGRLLGRTNQEIARDLGTTADAVRMIWNRSRQRLVNRGILRDGA